MKQLTKYQCEFPVIMDYEDEFRAKNLGKNNPMTLIGYICNEKNVVLGISVIGTTQSFFDQTFAKIKRTEK